MKDESDNGQWVMHIQINVKFDNDEHTDNIVHCEWVQDKCKVN